MIYKTAELVATDGTVDWFCCPRFDSPSVCASLLDADHGGYFRVGPDRDDYVSKQLYFPDTARTLRAGQRRPGSEQAQVDGPLEGLRA